MKKLLGILVLGLLLSSNAFAGIGKENKLSVYMTCVDRLNAYTELSQGLIKKYCVCMSSYYDENLTEEEYNNIINSGQTIPSDPTGKEAASYCRPLVSESEIHHEWTTVQKTNSGRDGYVDLVNLKKDGDHMYYWDLIDYGKPDQYGDSSNAIYWKVNCITLANKMIKQLFYKGPMATGAGQSIPIKSHQKGWGISDPGTFGDKAARMVCKKKYDM